MGLALLVFASDWIAAGVLPRSANRDAVHAPILDGEGEEKEGREEQEDGSS